MNSIPCRMTLYYGWNVLSLILLLIDVVMVTNGYSCEDGSYFPTCNCEERTNICETAVEFEEDVELQCCLDTSQPIAWYKETISNVSLIGYNGTTSTNYTTDATGIDEVHIYSNKFQFSDRGRTLTIKTTEISHAGNYTCSVSGKQPFSQLLRVKGASSYNVVLDQQTDQNCLHKVKETIFKEVSLCCNFTLNAFAANITIQWFAADDGSLEPLPTDHKIVSNCTESLEKVQASTTVLTSLKLNITQASYGNYTANVSVLTYKRQKRLSKQCHVTLLEEKSKDDRRELSRKFYFIVTAVIIVSCILIFIMIFCCIYYRYNISISLLYSYHCRPLKDDVENKEFDAYIVYSNADDDESFVTGKLRPFFENHKFSSCIRSINFLPGGSRVHDSAAAVQASRRTILILSPEFINNTCIYELEVALRNMIDFGKGHKIIPILLRNMPKSRVKEFKQLERVLFIVKKLCWVEENSDKFYEKLLKLMPSKETVISNQESRRFYTTVSKSELSDCKVV